MPAARILVVDDEERVRGLIRDFLVADGKHDVVEAATGTGAIEIIRSTRVDLVLLDWKLPDIDGIQVLRQLRESDAHTGVIMITAFGETDLVVRAMQAGANDFVDKSPEFFKILPVKVQRVLKDLREKSYLRGELAERYHIEHIKGESAAMKRVFDLLAKVAPTSASVLVQGDSGTGKELVARGIHHKSPRANKPFVAVNCAAIPEGLLESELFGHVRGAFTGAVRDKEGKFEQANEGTVFLDEVGDMSPALQAKVLRVLQEQTFTRVGGKNPSTVDVRVIAATNKDLKSEIDKGNFREDLYYRLAEFPIFLPPLRDRGEDIKLLVEFFIERHAFEIKKKVVSISAEAMEALRKYAFPGNVRELSSIIKRAIILEETDRIQASSLPSEIVRGERAVLDVSLDQLSYQKAKDEFEKRYLEKLLERANGNKTKAAELSGIERNNLKDKFKKHGIEIPRTKG